MDAEAVPTFKTETVMKLLQLRFKDEKTKVNADAAKLTVELMRVFVAEAAGRAALRAQREGAPVVHIEHLEKILPQILLDF